MKNAVKKTKKKEAVSIDDGTVVLDMMNLFMGSRKRKREGKPGQWMIKLVGDHEWMFVEPLELHEVYESFDYACELFEHGSLEKAEQLLRDVVKKAPLHIDALHHLAIILDGKGEEKKALELWEKAVSIGRSALPAKFAAGDHLEWGWLENRPFLRSLHGLAVASYAQGDTQKATSLYEELLSYNPNDNQGVRELLMEGYLESQEHQKALQICRKYPDDCSPGILYGFPLLLFKLGKKDQAQRKLLEAVKYSPKIRQELLKKNHKPPKTDMPGYITIGGWDEAYEYYRCFGKFWDEETLEWLKKNTNEKK